MRAFVAVDLAQEVLAEIEQFVARMEARLPGARWVVTTKLHLTLRFLGESDERQLATLAASLESIGSRYRPFTVRYRGIGFFPSARRPRIFWVGLDDPPEDLLNIHKDLEAAVRESGFEPERRPFSPHLTLARFRNPRPHPRFQEIAREFESQDFGTSRVPDLVLYQSILKREGAEYHALKRLALSG
jgi:2'-5' RNA ligase